jgi:hypothetical protein
MSLSLAGAARGQPHLLSQPLGSRLRELGESEREGDSE